MSGVFDEQNSRVYKYRFAGELHVAVIVGGIPSDPKVAEGWLKSKLADKDDLIRELVAETMVERGISAEEATEAVNINKHLNGFKRDPEKGLYIEGRQLKAAIKEAVSVAVAAGNLKLTGWGQTRKYLTNFLPEHVFVPETRLYLGADKPSGILQRFISTHRGTGIQYEEYVEDAKISFTVEADYDFTEQDWATIWLTGQRQGLGASRSQGFGQYEVTKWEKIK